MTDDVSRVTQPGRGVWVDGEEVEIERACCFRADALAFGDAAETTTGAGFDVLDIFTAEGDLAPEADRTFVSNA
jgi:hypothetical protein